MFGGAALDPGTPPSKRSWLDVAAHEGAHLILLQSKLGLDGLKWRPVLPGHANQAVEIVGREFGKVHTEMTRRIAILFTASQPAN